MELENALQKISQLEQSVSLLRSESSRLRSEVMRLKNIDYERGLSYEYEAISYGDEYDGCLGEE